MLIDGLFEFATPNDTGVGVVGVGLLVRGGFCFGVRGGLSRRGKRWFRTRSTPFRSSAFPSGSLQTRNFTTRISFASNGSTTRKATVATRYTFCWRSTATLNSCSANSANRTVIRNTATPNYSTFATKLQKSDGNPYSLTPSDFGKKWHRLVIRVKFLG